MRSAWPPSSASARATCIPRPAAQGRLAAGHLPAGAGGLGLRRAIPGRPYGFRTVIEAQSRGDAQALRATGQPVARVDLPTCHDGARRARSRVMEPNPLRDEFRMHRVPGSCAVVIFGGLGDLAGRKLVPALYNLYLRRLLPAGFAMIGIGRTDPGGDEGYRAAMRKTCEEFSRTPVTDAEWAASPRAQLGHRHVRRPGHLRRAEAAAGAGRASHGTPAACCSTCRRRRASSPSSSTGSATPGSRRVAADASAAS